MTIYLELGDYCEIAAELLGTSPEQIARLPRIALADSALAAPQAGFGGQDAYPSLIEKAAVLVEHLARNHPLPDGNKRAAFLSARRGSTRWLAISHANGSTQVVVGPESRPEVAIPALVFMAMWLRVTGTLSRSTVMRPAKMALHAHVLAGFVSA